MKVMIKVSSYIFDKNIIKPAKKANSGIIHVAGKHVMEDNVL